MQQYLDSLVQRYRHPDFITHDPICVPHSFAKKQDIEIAAFFAAIFAWGQRKTIIDKTQNLLQRMDNAPHDFIIHHTPHDLQQLVGFRHRTFNDTDAQYCIGALRRIYTQHHSLEQAFLNPNYDKNVNIEANLRYFHHIFFDDVAAPARTRKHIATPHTGSACKRLCMLLRWLVRPPDGIDFGIWTHISPAQLIIPLDVHVLRQAEALGLLPNQKANWQAAVALTELLKKYDANDPVKYDFALFGLGIEQKNTANH